MALLLHSMFEFWPIIEKILKLSDAKLVTEIGSENATTTKALCDWAVLDKACRIISVDVKPDEQLLALAKDFKQLKVLAKSSLEVLPELPVQDIYLIDGDHNYYTVYSELQKIHEKSVAHGHPVIIILHDVGWPCARRDLYYYPSLIPESFRQPFSFDMGITLDNSGLISGGFRGESAFACAEKEGGPRNGILTAIEDFMGQNPVYEFDKIDAVFGLGIMISDQHPVKVLVTDCITSYSGNFLLSTLERNRLELFLRVIALQDEVLELKKSQDSSISPSTPSQ
ncbi:MAG: hypothetical protein A2V81_03180 [Candidatus Abawacabacteria bacterium RBG_16_42_10]|uniref:Class I SAM-dependent methyltransferase n=1 Tax=Candidatus Abawacabacteria bacterium RBG_16_42_10 TaxID=1817814 RepID=A0A1F4XKE9_9BACT|nr:MAG: hypothetical protein A2V81_03180 [Candidatus Abawacabacteria bacterium RBG_16_42_10]